ncbi:NAD-dependent epimerase/dehydratase family protein [Mycolicibacterium novocastrense]|nr:NAD-dependent epimerase/dehydratase family protein [Mycolicibacterium novocastrense]
MVTGGGGFIGSYLVRRLLHDGWSVTVVDTMVRGEERRLAAVINDVQLVSCDVRDEGALRGAFNGADVVFHLAAVNGTENFYKQPELVLDVGIRGAIAVMNAGRDAGVPDVVVASTAEVYQAAATVPTSETVALTLPNSLNPRYSYGGSKIASELIAFNYGQDHFRRVQVFRPHNVYGPDMGRKHVVPQLILRAAEAALDVDRRNRGFDGRSIPFPIQGDGAETRAFCYVDDIVDGILTMYALGEHRAIYHIGNDDEISIRGLVARISRVLGIVLDVQPGPAAEGGTPRRCPDISKMRALGYDPSIGLDEGLERTVAWYLDHRHDVVVNQLL